MAGPTVKAGACDETLALETGDMQGLVARAYGHLPVARYLFLQISEPGEACAWLSSLAGEVTTAADRREDLDGPCVNVAFTGAGLRRLGLGPGDFDELPRPLQEGMVTEHRSRILGDTGASAPEAWRWGGPNNPEIHLVLMIFAPDDVALEAACVMRRAGFAAAGALMEVGAPIDGQLLADRGKEHFGFADGLSQPVLRGWPHGTSSKNPRSDPAPAKWSEVSPGEIVFGYCDNYQKPSEGPTVASDPSKLLGPSGRSGRYHLGRNGTLLVFRQLAQDVAGFHRLVDAADAAGSPGLLAAKLVGRWSNGTPLVVSPEEASAPDGGSNDFGFHDTDQAGLRCPLGAHIRRSNPRDSAADDPAAALSSTMNHRILRRGRPYGPADAPSSVPGEESGERGLVFICLNADIERQFEFVQHTWLNNPFFAGLYGEADPLVGTPSASGGTFTVPAEPIRQKVTGLPSFVTVMGGAYFFMPGIAGLRHLATLTR